MTLPVLLRSARDGAQWLQFRAAVLAAATTARPGAARWTELTVYRLPRTQDEQPPLGGYVVAKVGRSQVAHRPNCAMTKHRTMPTFLDAGEEATVRRSPCMLCMPEVGDGMDPHTLLEPSRYSVLQARDPEALWAVLLTGRHGEINRVTGTVAEIIRQIRAADVTFRDWEREQHSVIA